MLINLPYFMSPSTTMGLEYTSPGLQGHGRKLVFFKEYSTPADTSLDYSGQVP